MQKGGLFPILEEMQLLQGEFVDIEVGCQQETKVLSIQYIQFNFGECFVCFLQLVHVHRCS